MTSALRVFEFSIALLGLFFMSGTLTSYLTPEGSETAPMVQVLGAALGLFGILGLMLNRGAIPRIIGLYWLPLLPVAFAVISIAWTVDFSLTLRRAGALCLTTAFAYWLVFRFSPRQTFFLVIYATVCLVAANFITIQVDPIRGIHQAYDELTAQHAGSWRGLFGHKNDFGRLIALTTALLVLGFMFSAGGRFGKWLAVPLLGACGLMVVNSNSSQSMLLIATVPLATVLLLTMRRMSPTGRSLLLFVALPVTIFSALSAQLIFEYALQALGRDATMSGRTIIWEGVIIAMGGNALTGGGYGAGWQVIGPRLTALTGAEIGHAHNGYLDLAADIGWIGLGLNLFFVVTVGVVAFRNLMRGVQPEISALALTVVMFSLIGNIAGSFFLRHNSIYWVLLVTCYAKLRDTQGAVIVPRTVPRPARVEAVQAV